MTMQQTTITDTNRRTGRPAWLTPAAAAAYEAMRRDGMPGGCVADAGRTNAEQWEMWNRYLRGELTATAAYPGTSKHERGNALDLNEPARSWVREHGERYGWIKDRVRNEAWHMEHDGRTDLPPAREDDDMPLTDDDVKRIAKATATEVWRYKMTGGPDVAGKPVPTETAGERLRYVRRYLLLLAGRTS